MKTSLRGLALCVASGLLFSAIAKAQETPPPPAQPDTPGQADRPRPQKPDLDKPVPPEQLLAAQLLASRAVEAMPNQLAKQFDLTDAQKESARQILQNQWSAMPQADKDKMFGTLIQTRQLAISGQATAEDWQKLAKGGQPVIESMFKMLNDSAGEFEKVLTDEQKAKLAAGLADFRDNQQIMLDRVQRVADGTVKLEANGQPAGGWNDGGPEPGQRNAARVDVVEEEVDEVAADGTVQKVKIKRVKSTLPDEATVAANERYWTPFLKGYIAKYGLDDEQTKKARAMLGQALTRSREFRDRMKAALDNAARRVKEAEAGGDALALEAAQAGRDKLLQPVSNAFHDVQKQLDNLLTAAQRESGKTRGELFGPAKDAKDPAKK